MSDTGDGRRWKSCRRQHTVTDRSRMNGADDASSKSSYGRRAVCLLPNETVTPAGAEIPPAATTCTGKLVVPSAPGPKVQTILVLVLVIRLLTQMLSGSTLYATPEVGVKPEPRIVRLVAQPPIQNNSTREQYSKRTA